jgi:multisubunit Na+/H+ antiporter MnhB subunit
MMEVKGAGVLRANTSAISGDVTVIDLAKEANKEFPGLNPAKGEEKQRWYMLFVIGGLFVVLNAAVIWLIFYAIRIDVGFITAHPELADKRIITSGVFQALIGATVVQTGAVTWAMARFLFPNQPD